MTTYAVAFSCSLAVAFVMTVLVRNRALAYGWVDRQTSSRKIHERPIPRLGGIAVVTGFFVPLTALLFVDSDVGETFVSQHRVVWGLFVGGIAIATLGLYDDFRGADAKKKFTVQIAVAVLLYWLGFRIESIVNPFGSPLDLGWFSIPFTLIWIVGVINALNLIDGLDGLAGGVALFGVATNLVLSLGRNDVLMCLLMASLAGALLGFLVFNFNPASIFMGDTGSMFLGFVLAASSIKTSQKTGTAVSMLVPIVALGLPIMDTFLAMARRALLGRPIFSADREHIHHRLMSRFMLSHRRAVLVLYSVCCIFTLMALGLTYANGAQSAVLLAALSIVVIVAMRKLGYLSLAKASDLGKARRRNIQLRSLVKEVVGDLKDAHAAQAVWDAVRPTADAMGATRFELRLRGLADGVRSEVVRFDTRASHESGSSRQTTVEVKTRNEPVGSITVEWRDGRTDIDRDEEMALELISDAVGRAVARMPFHGHIGAQGKA